MDEQVIDDLYARAQSKGYKKGRLDFIQLIQSDEDVFNDMYQYVQAKGYKKDSQDFSSLIGKTEAPAVKKKDTASASEPGSLVSPEPEVAVEPAIAPAPPTPEIQDITGAPDPDFFEERMAMVSPELIDRGDEDEVAQELTKVFKPYGFDVEPTSIGDAIKVTAANGQTIEVDLDPWEVPGLFSVGAVMAGATTESGSSLQNFLKTGGEYDTKKEKSEAAKLKKFLRENKDESQTIAREDTAYVEPEKMFVTREQREAEVKKINKSHKEVTSLTQDYLKSERDFADKYPQFQTYDPEYIKNNPEEYQMFLADRNILEGEREFLGQMHQNTKDQGAQLDRLAGEYTEMLAERGYWSGGVFRNEFIQGAADIAAGAKDFGLDTGYNPEFLMDTDPEFFRDNYLKEAAAKGYDVPSASDMTVDEFKAWMKTDKGIPAKESIAIQNGIVDTKLKRRKRGEPIDYEEAVNAYSQYATSKNMEVTGGELDALRRGLDFLKDSEATPEAADLMYESFWGGALLGVTRSLPAMLFPIGGWAGRTAAMYSQITGFLEKEMAGDPDFQNISEAERFRLKLAIGSVSSVLEAVGLRNVLKQQGLLTGILMRVLKKTPANVKGKAFNEVVMREVNSAIGRGALVVTSAGLAEFETGFLQEGVDISFKNIYNDMKDKEMFETPETWSLETLNRMLYAGAQEAVGGFVLGTPGAISAARGTYDFTAIDDATFEMFENVSNLTAEGELTYRDMFYTNQQARINRGKISKEDAQQEMDNLDEVIAVNRDIPSDLTINQQKRSLGILLRRKDLQEQIEGKDPILVKRQLEELDGLNGELEEILYGTPEDAIQEQGPESVDAPESTRDSEAVGEGVPDIGEPTTKIETEDDVTDEAPAPTAEVAVDEGATQDISENQKKESVLPEKGNFGLSEKDLSLKNERAFGKKGSVGIYVDDESGETEIIIAVPNRTKEDSYLGYKRIKEKGKFTNKWSIKADLKNAPKGTTRAAFEAAVEQLPEGHILVETSNISSDGITLWSNQLKNNYVPTGKTFTIPVNVAGTKVNLGGRAIGNDEFTIGSFSESEANIAEVELNKLISSIPDASVTRKKRPVAPGDVAQFKFDITLPEIQRTSVVAPKKTVSEPTQEVTEEEQVDIDEFFGEQEIEGVEKVSENLVINRRQMTSDTRSRAKEQRTINRVKQLAIKAAVSLSKQFPDVRIVLHETPNQYKRFAGELARGSYDYNNKTVHINLTNANLQTVAHEVFHALILEKALDDPNAVILSRKMLESVKKTIDPNSEFAQKIDKFVDSYADRPIVQDEEYLAELTGMLAAQYKTLDKPAQNAIKEFFRKLAKLIGIDKKFGLDEYFGPEFLKTDAEVVDLMNTISRKIRQGVFIESSDLAVMEKIKKKSTPEELKKARKDVEVALDKQERRKREKAESGTGNRRKETAVTPRQQVEGINPKDVRMRSRSGNRVGKGLSVKKVNNEAVVEEIPDLTLDYVRENAPASYLKNANLIAQYPLVRGVKNFDDVSTLEQADEVYEVYARQVADNLNWIMESYPEEYREISTLWYDGANKIANELAADYGVSPEQVAGIIASLSPQNDWYQNVRAAELSLLAFRENPVMSQKMIDYQVNYAEGKINDLKKRIKSARKAKGKSQAKAKVEKFKAAEVKNLKAIADAEALLDLLRSYKGKRMEDAPDALKPYYVRLYNEVNQPKSYPIISPDGNYGSDALTDAGGKRKFGWGSYTEIGKGVSIRLDGSQENISVTLGQMHKIRNFFNNIIDPMSKEKDITMDTHAIAAALLIPASSKTKEVVQNFGTGTANSGVKGQKGLYYANQAGYFLSAEENNMLPRQVQSVTWEAVRGLFTSKFKDGAKNVKSINDIWENYAEGNITIEQARQEVLEKADGINAPSWAGLISDESRDGDGTTTERGRGKRGGPATEREGVAPRQQVADVDKKIDALKAKQTKASEAEYKRDKAGKPAYSKAFFAEDDKFRKEIERLELLKLGLAPAYEQRVKISEELDELNKPFEREVGNKYYPRLGTVSKGEMTGEDSDLGGIYEAEVDGYLFRGVSVEDYNRIKKEGFIDTDLRGAISDKEGINLTPYSATAFNYLPEGVEGVVMAMKVSDKSGLFMIGADDYVRSSKPIPFTDVEFVTTPVIEGRYLSVKDGKSTPIAIKKVSHPSKKTEPDVAPRQQLSDIATPLPRQQKSVREVVQQARDNNFKDAATKDFLKRKGVPTADIDKAIKTLDEVYARVMKEIAGVIAKSQKRGVDFNQQLDNALAYLQGTKLYEDTTDIHREKLMREVRAKFDKKEKRAPSAKRILGNIKDVKTVTLKEKEALKMQLRLVAKTAKTTARALVVAGNELTKSMKEMVKGGVITANQMSSVLRRFSRVDLFNPASIDSFLDYMAKIFADAEYGAKIARIKKLLPRAKKNIKSKIGVADVLGDTLTKLFNVNPTLIPMQMLEDYIKLVEMMGASKNVLPLADINDVTEVANKVLNAVYEEISMAEDLAEVFANYENKVIKDGKLDYAATIEAMIADQTISLEEAAVMRKYKSRIVEPTKKEPKTEAEIAEERAALMSAVEAAKVNVSRLVMEEERTLARQLAKLMGTDAIERLSNQQLETLLAVIDNINNGFVTHAAQRLAETMNASNRAESLSESVAKAKPLSVSTFIGKIKAGITKNNKFFESVKRNPLAYLDQVFGDFKTTRIYDAIFKPLAQAYDTFSLEMKRVDQRLTDAQNAVMKSFKNDPNKARMSSYKMMAYMLQREFEANPDNKQVNPAADFIRATIDHINKGQSFFKGKDAEMLQQILDDFGGEQIDSQKLYDSFNKAERNALAVMEDINKSMGSKAVFTGAVIRGRRVDALNQYAHHNVLSTSGQMDRSADVSIIEAYNQSMRASTKAKNLIERTGVATPLNFDVFSSVSRGSRFTLTDFYLTEPIRTSRKTISDTRKLLEERGDVTKQENEIVNSIENALELALDDLLTRTFSQSTMIENVVQYVKKTGYRLVLASATRAGAEYLSNVNFAVIYAPKDFAAGMANKKMVMGTVGIDVMSNLKSTQLSRMYPNEILSGRMIDTSVLGEKAGDKGGRAYGDVRNKITQIYNGLLSPAKKGIELVADTLISAPDKAIIRPLWFGSFENAFVEITGKKPDFEKISANDEAYMEANQEALDKATDTADQVTTLAGAADNPFKSMLRGKYPSKAKQTALLQFFNNFNSFMTRFLIYEYISARTAVNAMLGNGMISKRQGAALLGAVVTRMVTYTLLNTVFALLLKQAFGLGDEEDEKDIEKQFGQALASTAVSLIVGRDFGNVVKGLLNYGVENLNEEFLDELRDGDYDPYRDSIAYTFVPADKEYKSNTLADYIRNLMGPFGTFYKMAEFGVKALSADEKKDPAARLRQLRELNERLPLEVLGNLGLIPLYRDIRALLLADIYKDMGKEKKGGKTGMTKAEKAQMKEYFPELYEMQMQMEEDMKNPELERFEKEMKLLEKQIEESLKQSR